MEKCNALVFSDLWTGAGAPGGCVESRTQVTERQMVVLIRRIQLPIPGSNESARIRIVFRNPGAGNRPALIICHFPNMVRPYQRNRFIYSQVNRVIRVDLPHIGQSRQAVNLSATDRERQAIEQVCELVVELGFNAHLACLFQELLMVLNQCRFLLTVW